MDPFRTHHPDPPGVAGMSCRSAELPLPSPHPRRPFRWARLATGLGAGGGAIVGVAGFAAFVLNEHVGWTPSWTVWSAIVGVALSAVLGVSHAR